MTPYGDPLRDLDGFRVGDVVVCPSGMCATVTNLRPDGKVDAVYTGVARFDGACNTTLDTLTLRHAPVHA